MAHQGSLRHLVIRQTARTKELLINLVVSSQIEKQDAAGDADGFRNDIFYKGNYEEIKECLKLDAWVEALSALELHGKIAGVLLTINDSLG